MRSKNPKPSSKFVVSTSSEESSSSDRTMDDFVVIGTITVNNLDVSSGRDVGLHAGNETGQFFKYPENVDVAKKFLQYKKSLNGEWGNYVINTGLWFKTLVRLSGNVEHYQVPSLDRWKRSMDIGDDIDIIYYNRTGAEVVEEGFLCYLNQVAYKLIIPLIFFQKGVMNALKSCPGQLNGNIFEMMRVCEALNQKWRDGGIARQFIADDVLKYYKFKYVKDRKSGYLFSDSTRPKFFDFESSKRPWCDHLVMVRGNCMQVPGEPALELIYKNFNEKTNPKVATDTSSLFDFISREGNELNKVLGELGIRREKRLNSVVEKKKEFGKDIRASSKGVNLEAVEQEALDLATRDPIRLDTQIRSSISQGLSREDVDLALAGKYGETVFPGDDAPPVAEQTSAPPVADNPTKEEVVHLRGKVIEMEKALSRARDSINRTQQGLKEAYLELLTKRGIVPDPARVKFLAQEARNRHSREAQRCSARARVSNIWGGIELREKVTLLETPLLDTHQRLQVSQSRLKKKITPKQRKRVIKTDQERQITDVIAFYGGELERVENEFRHYISICGKDVEVENDKIENMWLAKGNEGRGALTSKPRAEESKEEEVEDLLPHTRHKTRPLENHVREKIDHAKTHEEACSKKDRGPNEAINKCNSQIVNLDRDKQALVLEYMQGNEVFEELHMKYKESQRMMNAAEAEINYSREIDKKLHRLKQEMERSVQMTKQYRGSLPQEKISRSSM
ncbi:hypothetical protein GIB67_000781 [Kingdonia uniflora]|uniref:Uncharacterized protein n=1 Tax=Kingdonia uniflora TaxID=39325 RepID=A0A7J7P050_9MAGN|nr:hypothetical protein GIB67_000781 [Kingdonia uniflora]